MKTYSSAGIDISSYVEEIRCGSKESQRWQYSDYPVTLEEEQAELKLFSKLGLGGKLNNALRRDKMLFELNPVPSTKLLKVVNSWQNCSLKYGRDVSKNGRALNTFLPPIPPPLGTSSGNTGNPNINRVDMMPTTNDTINTMTTTNVAQSVVDENLPQLLDSRGGSHATNVSEFDKEDFISCKVRDGNDLILAHEGPSDTRDTKIVALRLKFNAFKSLEGEKVNGTFTRLKCLLNDLENNGVIIPQAEVNATFVNSLPRKRLSMNQTQRFGKVGSSRKSIDKSKESCYTCGKPGHFQKDSPSNKTSTPSYPSSNNFFNKPKTYTPSFTQTSSQNTGNHQKDFKGKYKGLKAEMVVLTKRIDDLTKGKSEKGNNEKRKSEKGLIAESFDWDEESVSPEDEETTKIKAFMAIAEDEPSVKKTDAKIWIRVNLEYESLKDEICNLKKALGGRAPEITSDSKSECETQDPLPPLPKLIGAEPTGTSNSLC
ncbi:retrovirus-related pol polyprotein from transposon TNT 1-94 [Tanacetum coccineum]